jgi:PPM family protein phosphatase
MNAILHTAAGNPENQDRGAVIHSPSGLILVVADGAGGRSGGAEAATLAIEVVRRTAHELHDSESCVGLLREMDHVIAKDDAAGETTCALAVITEAQLYGASVGDSGILLIGQSDFADLTQGQSRKPFIGSGTAGPVSFIHDRSGAARLLLATDGLLKYTSAERIVEACRTQDTETAARQLIELVRYRSGALPDDVTVILARL